jgi:hypothetical protein
MANLLKIIGRSVGIIIEWVLILIILFAFFIRTSAVQTYLAQVATTFLSKELKATIHIDGISIIFIDRIAVDGLLIKDQNKDTLLYVDTFFASLDEFNQLQKKIVLSRVKLDNGIIQLNRDKVNGEFNYTFLVDYFSGNKGSKSKPFALMVKDLNLSNVHMQYDDNRKGRLLFGMDYDHLKFNRVNFNAKNVSSKNDIIKLQITDFSTEEQCGFKLNNLSAYAKISAKGLYFKYLKIKTPHSKVDAPQLYMKMHSFQNYNSFLDSVDFDAKLSKSMISMQDIAYFAPELEGMDQQVEVQARVTQKVKNLKIDNLNLKTGKKTQISGNFTLPDFRTLDDSYFREKINYAYIDLDDLESIKLPKESSRKVIHFDPFLEKLAYFELKDLKWAGTKSRFFISAENIHTSMGDVKMENGIEFNQDKLKEAYHFNSSLKSINNATISAFQLGTFINDPTMGKVDGTLLLAGSLYNEGGIDFSSIQGQFSKFEYNNYVYQHITINEGSFVKNIFQGDVEIKDENIGLIFQGSIDLNDQYHYAFDIGLNDALLSQLNVTKEDNIRLSSNLKVDLYGNSEKNLHGTISVNKLEYFEGDKDFDLPQMNITLQRGVNEDILSVVSPIAQAEFKGKIDLNTFSTGVINQFGDLFPSLVTAKEITKTKKKPDINSIDFTVHITEINDFLSIFIPDLKLANQTTFTGHYNSSTRESNLVLSSPYVYYQKMKFSGVNIQSSMNDSSLDLQLIANKFYLNDTINVNELTFQTTGKNNTLNSQFYWNKNTDNDSYFDWQTTVNSWEQLDIQLEPSYFNINKAKWNIENKSMISINPQYIGVKDFLLKRENQYISLDGIVSKNDSDKLNFKINDFRLDDFGSLLGSSIKMKGLVNGWGYISNPFTNLMYMGDANIQELELNEKPIGNIFIQSQWNSKSESIGLTGDLMYQNQQTFAFDGHYYLNRKTDNLDFNLIFDRTDIQFTNTFMDPNVVDGIRGLVDGSLHVTGSNENPQLEGEVELLGGNAKVGILGANFGFNGKIISDKYGFYINNMPIIDEEGNSGSLIGSIYHDNFLNWNFDLFFNLEDDSYNRDPFTGRPAPLDRFMVLNTTYKEGDVYYGKGYATGYGNIEGYADNLGITVNLKTKRGTAVNFPMYGTGEIEEDSFIKFVSTDSSLVVAGPKIDFTGVNLDLNFNVTPDAKLKIIFDDLTGDEITATGSGDITVKLDNIGDVGMDGTYKVKNGVYNFSLGLIKQNFYIQEGGTISWAGDPFNASLDLKTYNKVNANVSALTNDQLTGPSGNSSQEILCYISLTESLLRPQIELDIQAPKAPESVRAVIDGIRSDKNELNKQFFSLLLWKRFEPLNSSGKIGGNVVLDLLSNNINSKLSEVSKDYKLNVNMNSDQLSGESSYELGVSKGFLDDKLIVSGSFGVENSANSAANQSQSSYIGDVSVEYLLNESGTFRINIFNESNDNKVIQDKNLGQFTQGTGLHYQENFDQWKHAKMFQSVLDLFRNKGHKRFPNQRNQTPVPPKTTDTSQILREREAR